METKEQKFDEMAARGVPISAHAKQEPTYDDVAAAGYRLQGRVGALSYVKLRDSFGVASVAELPKSKYSAFIEAANRLIADKQEKPVETLGDVLRHAQEMVDQLCGMPKPAPLPDGFTLVGSALTEAEKRALRDALLAEHPPFSVRATEKKRPALDWNKPTVFDPFPGFEMESRSFQFSEDAAAHAPRNSLQLSPDLQEAKHQVVPLHGSAALLKG